MDRYIGLDAHASSCTGVPKPCWQRSSPTRFGASSVLPQARSRSRLQAADPY